jgi:hypothetical protein
MKVSMNIGHGRNEMCTNLIVQHYLTNILYQTINLLLIFSVGQKSHSLPLLRQLA